MAVETIALPLLVEVAKPLVKLVSSRVTEEVRFIVGFRREFEDLQEKIQFIADTVDSMTVEPDRAAERWLRKVIRIFHSAENMMDVLAYEKQRCVVMKRRSKKTFTGKISRLVFLPVERACLRLKMASWIRKINTDIDAAMNKGRLIKEIRDAVNSSAAATNSVVNGQQITNNKQAMLRRNVDTSLFVGRESDVTTVVDILLNRSFQDSHDNICQYRLPVVAIIGIGEQQRQSC